MYKEPDDEPSGVEEVLSSMFPNASKTVPKAMSPELKELWAAHRKGNLEARNRLVEVYFGIVEANVKNVIDTILQAIEESDFHSAGMVGFLESFDEYAEDSTTSFEDFSSLKVREAIKNELNCFIAE